jgi:hypothetical protein
MPRMFLKLFSKSMSDKFTEFSSKKASFIPIKSEYLSDNSSTIKWNVLLFKDVMSILNFFVEIYKNLEISVEAKDGSSSGIS